jgi:hypothetical protein
MTEGRYERLAPLAGVLFFALALIGTVIIGDTPEFVDEPAEIASHYEENESEVLTANTMYLLGTVALLWFLGSLRSVLRRAEPLEGRLSAIALAGGTAGAALLFAAAATDMAGALRVMERDEIDAQTASVYYDLSSVLFGLAAPMAFAVLLLATAVATLRHGALPVWHAWISIALAIAMLVPPVGYIAMIVFIFWVLVTSILLYVGRPGVTTPAPAATAASGAPPAGTVP